MHKPKMWLFLPTFLLLLHLWVAPTLATLHASSVRMRCYFPGASPSSCVRYVFTVHAAVTGSHQVALQHHRGSDLHHLEQTTPHRVVVNGVNHAVALDPDVFLSADFADFWDWVSVGVEDRSLDFADFESLSKMGFNQRW